MQRLVAGLRTPLAVATPIAVGTQHPTHPQTGAHQGTSSPTRQQVEGVRAEEHDGFMHIGLDAPIASAEVVAALTDLSALGGLSAHRAAPAAAPAPAAAAPPPLIEELDAESEASSDGSAANGLMAAVDSYNPFPLGERQAGAIDLLTDVISGMVRAPPGLFFRLFARHLSPFVQGARLLPQPLLLLSLACALV
jgi:hypothetical protein